MKISTKIEKAIPYLRQILPDSAFESSPINVVDLTNVYSSIYTLTLDRFIECLCTQDMSKLIIDSKIPVSSDSLFEAWEKIHTEYIDALKDTEQQYFISLSKEINVLQTKYNLIELIIHRLSIQHNQDTLNELKKILNVPGKFDPEDVLQYSKDLQLVLNTAKSYLVQIDAKKKEFEKVMPTNDVGKVDRSHFDSLLIQLSKHMKFRIDRNETLVSEFVGMVVDMRATFEKLSKTTA